MKKIFFKISSLWVAFLIVFNSNAAAMAGPQKIGQETALKLLKLSRYSTIKNVNYFEYEGDDSPMSPPFYAYGEMGLSEGINDFFAVNPWTGDVWSLWECKKISTPASRKMQSEIKRRFTPEELKQYPKLSQLKPECM